VSARDLTKERRAWEVAPRSTVALLVVVDRYAGLEPLDDVAAPVGRLAERMLSAGVLPDNILLLCSEEGRADFPEGLVRLGQADLSGLRNAFSELRLRPEAELIWLHWVGHGIHDGKAMQLVSAEADTNPVTTFDASDLKKVIGDDPGIEARRHMFTIDACQDRWDGRPLPLPTHPEGHRGRLLRFSMYGSRPGAASVFGNAGGLFTQALVNAIDELAEPDRWPPDVTRLADAVTETLNQALGGELDTTQWCTETPWEGFRDRRSELGGAEATGTRDVRRPRIAWWIPPGWSPGAYHPDLGSRTQLNLDLRLVVDRTCRSALVADRWDADLAADLNRAEEVVDRAQIAAGTSRRWTTIVIDSHHDPMSVQDPASLVLEGRWPKADLHGVVLRVDVPAGVHPADDVRDLVRSWVRRVTGTGDPVTVAVAVRGHSALEAIAGARKIVAALEPTNEADDVARVLTRFRPGDAAGPGPDGEQAAQHGTGPTTVCGLLGDLAGVAARHGLPVPFPVDARYAGLGSAGPLSDRDARALVAELNDPAFAWPPKGSSSLPDEVFLCAVRDLRPASFAPLLAAYAGHRDGVGWGVGLAVAAQFWDDLETWLLAAQAAGLDPHYRAVHEWPPPVYRHSPADAVVTLLTRQAAGRKRAGEAGGAWANLALSPGVEEALRILQNESGASDCGPGAIATLVGLGASPEALLGPAPDSGGERMWAALRVASATNTDLAALLAWTGTAPDQDMVRAVLGLEPLRGTPEPLIRQQVDDLRRILHHIDGG
jgi:hypothetical protein